MQRSFTDQLNRTVTLDFPPRRIVSLVPSQTELLYSLGLEKEVVGITKFCVEPDSWFRSKTRVGGTKQVHFDRIADLRPDLILANKEENDREEILALAKEYPVWVSDIYTLEDAFSMISQIGSLCGVSEIAERIIQRTRKVHNKWKNYRPREPYSAAYLIWHDPLMVAGGNTFIDHMMTQASFVNIFSHLDRYPIISKKDIKEGKPELILLSSEPFPFKEKHRIELEKEFPESRIMLVDGMAFSWYGSRLRQSLLYFARLHSDIFRAHNSFFGESQ